MTLDEIREVFSKDRFATEAAGILIEEAEDGFARCRMEIRPVHRNAMGAVMGGALFTLADFAFAVASNCGGTPVVSLNSQITYLSAAKGKTLFAEARRIRQGRRTGYYRITVSDELGTMAAEVVTTGFVVEK